MAASITCSANLISLDHFFFISVLECHNFREWFYLRTLKCNCLKWAWKKWIENLTLGTYFSGHLSANQIKVCFTNQKPGSGKSGLFFLLVSLHFDISPRIGFYLLSFFWLNRNQEAVNQIRLSLMLLIYFEIFMRIGFHILTFFVE